MISETRKLIRMSLKLLLALTILTGVLYPLAVTCLAQLFFPWKANGSLIRVADQYQGSRLIGQAFQSPQYFGGRPSSTTPFPYNASASSGSNAGPSNPEYLALIESRVKALQKANPEAKEAIPVDLVTASGSGLDPEISPRAAYYQIPRIAKARHIPVDRIRSLVDSLTKPRTFGILGEPRVNVLELNLALDHLTA